MRKNPFYTWVIFFLMILMGGNQMAVSFNLTPSKDAVRSLRRSARRRFDTLFGEEDELSAYLQLTNNP
jgi:hypothetical protein